MDVEATSQGPLETGADTIAVGLFKDEPAPGDLPIAPLLESGEARGELAALAALHVEDRRVITVGLGHASASTPNGCGSRRPRRSAGRGSSALGGCAGRSHRLMLPQGWQRARCCGLTASTATSQGTGSPARRR